MEYFENAGSAQLQLMQTVDVEQVFQAWIPPGNWQDIWTGTIHAWSGDGRFES